jgi:hypothetical protein
VSAALRHLGGVLVTSVVDPFLDRLNRWLS